MQNSCVIDYPCYKHTDNAEQLCDRLPRVISTLIMQNSCVIDYPVL